MMAAPGAPDPALTAERDLCYGTVGGAALLLDLLYPAAPPVRPRPAVVYIHGGGWMSGDKADFNPNTALARAGFFTANLNYRLSPGATFPAQLQDVRRAVRWLRRSADRFGIDPARVGAWGHSAGAHLAALLGQLGPDEALDQDDPAREVSPRVQAVVACSTPTDLVRSHFPEGHAWPPMQDGVYRALFGGPLEQHLELARFGSPLTHAGLGMAPLLLVHGEHDDVIPVAQAQLLYDALVRAGTPVTLLRRAPLGHDLAEDDPGWARLAELARQFFSLHLGA